MTSVNIAMGFGLLCLIVGTIQYIRAVKASTDHKEWKDAAELFATAACFLAIALGMKLF